MNKTIRLASVFTGSLTVAFLIFMGILIAYGQWQEPGAAPPNGDTPAPLNAGNFTQVKLGNLILNSNGAFTSGLLVNRDVDIYGGNLKFFDNPLSGINAGIIQPGGGPGVVGDVLTRTPTGMAWASSPAGNCSLIGTTQSGLSPGLGTNYKLVSVPSQCINSVCTLILISRNVAGSLPAGYREYQSIEYIQFPTSVLPPGGGSSGEKWLGVSASPNFLGSGHGANGDGYSDSLGNVGESEIGSPPPISAGIGLTDDWSTLENSPTQWVLVDNLPTRLAELYLCN